MSKGRQGKIAVEPLEQRNHFAIDPAVLPLTYGGPGFDSAQRVISNATGTVVAGLFSGTVDFNPGAGVSRLTARGDSDIYVTKFDASGNFVWARQIGGGYTDDDFKDYEDRKMAINPIRLSGFIGRVGDQQPGGAGEYVQDLAVDSTGLIYIAGSFHETITAGNISLTADQTFNDDYNDALVVQIDASGTVQWARNFGGPFDDVAMTLSLDGQDNPYVGGYYTRSADFDPSSRVYLLKTVGRDAGFVMRLTKLGALGWVYHFDSEEIDPNVRNAVNDIAVTPSGNVYFVGTFGDEADFDPSRKSYVLDAQGQSDAFLGLLNRKGQLNWVMRTGGDDYDGNVAVAISNDGGIYTGGYFEDKVDVDPRPNVTRLFTATDEDAGDSPEYPDLLVSRFAVDGTPAWQAQLGGEYLETISDLVIGDDGSVYTVGSFMGAADFAPGSSRVTLTSLNFANGDSVKDGNTTSGREETYDWYVSRISPRGKYIDANRYGGQDDDFASGFAINGSDIYLSGRAVSTRPPERGDRNEQSLILLLDDLLNSQT